MINWSELATRAAAGPWTEEEFRILNELTEFSPAARYLTEVVELIKSAGFPGCEENELTLVPEMLFPV